MSSIRRLLHESVSLVVTDDAGLVHVEAKVYPGTYEEVTVFLRQGQHAQVDCIDLVWDEQDRIEVYNNWKTLFSIAVGGQPNV